MKASPGLREAEQPLHRPRGQSGGAPRDSCEVPALTAPAAAVRERLPGERIAQDLAETFRVLADPGRVRLIVALLEAGELCVCELSAATDLSQTACSHSLRLLRAHRIVRYRKVGRNVFYSLDDDHVRLLLDVALQHVGEGDFQAQ